MNKQKILIWSVFAVSAVIVGVIFVTATTYIQLAVAIFLYPLLALFFFRAFPRRIQMVYNGGPAPTLWPQTGSTARSKTTKEENTGIIDIDKRMFLKLIGGAGLAYFLFSIFNKDVGGLFFKNLSAQKTTSLGAITDKDKASLAQNQPMDGYSISEIDDNIIAFYGFTNEDGAWFIMKEDTDTGSFRYVKGNSDFPGNWNNRTNLKYDYYSNVFKL